MSLLSNYAEYYYKIENALKFIQEKFPEQPDLEQIASKAFLSQYHFQRIFKQWVGISPKRFLQFLTVEHAKKLLEHSKNLLDVTYDVGLSSPGRLHDLFINCEAMSPGQYKEKGRGLKILYGIHPTQFGYCLLSITDIGICGLDFVNKNHFKMAINNLKSKWIKAEIKENASATYPFIESIFIDRKKSKTKIELFLKGTNFEIKVWKALLTIPPGFILSYNDIAKVIRKPNAIRAVANAIAKNPIGYIIPCHRVIRKIGVFGQYHWGVERKKAILGWEISKHSI
jgi:AraC family transcriptional regulator of adaptative response/methylated-DNA-[protein]-cysteine methyltransferase